MVIIFFTKDTYSIPKSMRQFCCKVRSANNTIFYFTNKIATKSENFDLSMIFININTNMLKLANTCFSLF